MTRAHNPSETLTVLLASPVPPPYHGGIITWTQVVRDGIGSKPDVQLSLVDTESRYRGIPWLPRLSRVLFGSHQALRDTWRVFRRLKTEPIDLLHLNTSAGPATLKDILILRIARAMGVPSIIHYHMGNPPYTVTNDKLHWRLILRAMALATAVVTLDCRSERCVKEALPDQRVVTLPNMVQIDVVDKIREQATAPPVDSTEGPRVVFVGAVTSRKGVHELAEAFSRLGDRPWTMVFVGPASQEMQDTLRSIVARHGADVGRFRFRGSVNHDEALRFIQTADIFVLPSRGESAPISVLEAMACGRPIVSTTVGAIPEMLDIGGPEECGVCVEPRDVDALTAALDEVLSNEAKRAELGRKARQRAEKVFDAPVACEKLLDLWRSVANLPDESSESST